MSKTGFIIYNTKQSKLMKQYCVIQDVATTIPILIASLIVLVMSNLVHMNDIVHAVLSTISVVLYLCFFVMGFGPTPNILYSEIFPTRVRGICIGICLLTFWICNILITYSLPCTQSRLTLLWALGQNNFFYSLKFIFR